MPRNDESHHQLAKDEQREASRRFWRADFLRTRRYAVLMAAMSVADGLLALRGNPDLAQRLREGPVAKSGARSHMSWRLKLAAWVEAPNYMAFVGHLAASAQFVKVAAMVLPKCFRNHLADL